MSIATSITGGSSSNALMDLLAVVANPDVYKAKMDALDAATAENKKYVEALAPASEIFAMREQIKAKNAEADDALADARTRADAAVKAANENANGIVDAAQKTAESLVFAATAAKAEADSILAQAKEAMRRAEVAQAAADNAKASADAQAEKLASTQAEMEQALADAQAAKADILAKHQAFIKGL